MRNALDTSMAAPLPRKQATPSNSKLILATSLGGGLEVYDNTIFSFFAIVIGQQFFAAAGSYGSLMLSVSVFAVGFLVRPLGSLYFGSLADRKGRKSALLASIMLMALGVLLIAFCPPYAQIGMAAPIILITGRLLQGFSLGGEFGAATTLAMESCAPRSRGYVVSWQTACQGAATLAGGLVAFALTTYLPAEQFQSWGWRLGFVVGLSIAPVGLYIRSQMTETLDKEAAVGTPLADLWHGYRRQVILGIVMMLANSSLLYVVVLYMPTYLVRELGYHASTAYLASIVSSLVLLVVAPLSGLLADRLPRRKPILLVSMLLPSLLIYPVFVVLGNTQALPVALTLLGATMAIASFGSGAFYLLLLEAFPAKVRASGLSIIYSIGVSVVGGCSQLFVTWLIKFSGNPLSPAWFMMACGLISYAALLMFREEKRV